MLTLLLALQTPTPEVVRADLSDGRTEVDGGGLSGRIGGEFTALVRFRLDALPAGGRTALLTKRPAGWQPTPFVLGVTESGQLQAQMSDGLADATLTGSPGVTAGAWHVAALAFRAGDRARLFLDGREVGSAPAPRDLEVAGHAWRLGRDDAWNVPFQGRFAWLAVYARALDANGVRAAADGTLNVLPATDADLPVPRQWIELQLTRYDQPLPLRNARQGDVDPIYHRRAIRRPGPDALDWPEATLDGRPLFRSDSVEILPLDLRQGDAMRPLGRVAEDARIEPGNHWLRVGEWFWSRKQVYTTDPAMRGFGTRAELIGFPVRLDGPLTRVRLESDGREVYRREEPLASLTLVLPAGSYRLTVDGESTDLRVGPEPVLGPLPDERAMPVDRRLGAVRVRNGPLPDSFADGDAWRESVAELGSPLPDLPTPAAPSFAERIGVEMPSSGVTVNGISLPAGMSTGWWGNGAHGPAFRGTEAEYAAHLRNLGFDRVFGPVGFAEADDLRTDRLAAALAERGIGFGASLEATNSANYGLYASALPEYGAPSRRDFGLATQWLGRYPNFWGFCQGADNAGYTSYWDWAGPILNRPFARALEAAGLADRPLGPWLTPANSFERRSTQREFLAYAHWYAQTWRAHGAAAREVAQIRPGTRFTTGSFGSSPGVGGRGGWPWASIPERELYADVPVVQAYDWSETSAAKPLHNLALTDRLRSEFPTRPAWSLVDDFGLFYGRAARERAYALALTRGVAAVGTTFLPHAGLKPEKADEYRDLFAQVHALGGALRLADPDAPLGILFVHDQAISRPIHSGPDASEGSHEGRVTEALVMAHAAGWPARVVTDAELRRGLPSKLKALLLVGLDRPDATWTWSDGLEPALRTFAARGGRILRDAVSVCPVPSVGTGMRVAAYAPQADVDPWPEILARNETNVATLRRAMEGVAVPVAASSDPLLWAVPATAGEVTYVAALNWAFSPGQNASQVTPARSGTLRWKPGGAIYDLKARRRVTSAEASRVAFEDGEGVRWFARTARPVGVPTLSRVAGERPWVRVRVGGTPGVPVRVSVQGPAGAPAVFHESCSKTISLPVTRAEGGRYRVEATELLSGRTARLDLDLGPGLPPKAEPPAPDMLAFWQRREPLVLAVSPEQANDPAIARLRERLALAGRPATMRLIAPGDVVTGLQPIGGDLRFPQWRTIPADLVLVGTPQSNVLIRDQAKGRLLKDAPAQVTASPFVAGYQTLVLREPRLPSLKQSKEDDRFRGARLTRLR